MYIGYPLSFALTAGGQSFVLLQKSHLILILTIFILIALLIFTSLQKMFEDTVKHRKFVSGMATIVLVALGLNSSAHFIRLSHNDGNNGFTPTIFFARNFIIGLTISIVVTVLLGWSISKMLRNAKVPRPKIILDDEK
jgi:hypothetical protein